MLRRIPVASLLLFAACASAPHAPPATHGAAPTAAPTDLERLVSIRDTRTGEELALAALADQLAASDVVFLGETHDDDVTHRFELAVLEALAERRDVVLALEMFERDVQSALDDYLAGRTDEATFLERARPWGNYAEAYRPLVELARERGLPVVASNFPRPWIGRAREGGLAALEDEPNGVDELHANTPLYHRRTDNAVRGHLGMMGGPRAPDDPRLDSTQTLWDNAMGEACARALREHPGSLVLHVNGGFHSAYWDGTVRQLALRVPDARVQTVAIEPRAVPGSAPLRGAPSADWVVFAESRAKDGRGGSFAVALPDRLRYRLHVPDEASDAAPVPLFVWLGDAGVSGEDGLALWKERLGDACAIAALEPAHRALADDLGPGGRWYFEDTFAEDVLAAAAAVERVCDYLARRAPVDAERLVVAGEGTGATVALVAAIHSAALHASVLAFEPRAYEAVKGPPPAAAGPARRGVCLTRARRAGDRLA